MQLYRERGRIEAAGGTLVMVGNGSVAHARHFAEKFVSGITVLTDPRRETYDALGLKRGVMRTLGPATWAGAVGTALRSGQTQTAVQGDAWQQGGFFVFAPDGAVIFEQVNQSAADRPFIDDIVDAVRVASQA